MAAKRCPKCGSTNPRYFTHCVECGTRLEEEMKKPGKTLTYLKTVFILCAAILITIFIIVPLYQQSVVIGKNASEAISAVQTPPPRTESSLNMPVGNNEIQITMNSARDGGKTYNANKFFLVSATLKNIRSSGNITIYSNDFTLIDTEGNSFTPYGIGSKVMYDLGPSQQISGAELTFVIPQKASVKEIQFTFPGTSALAANRPVVAFVL